MCNIEVFLPPKFHALMLMQFGVLYKDNDEKKVNWVYGGRQDFLNVNDVNDTILE